MVKVSRHDGGEFELIQRYFGVTQSQAYVPGLMHGIGDDAAIVDPMNQHLAVSSDAFYQDIHFQLHWPPEAIAHRALVGSVSDIIAMGALPRWFTLSLALPEANTDFLERFSQTLCSVSKEIGVGLIGGDLTRAALYAIVITVFGTVIGTSAVLRSGAGNGDGIYLSGSLGSVSYALSKLGKLQLSDSLFHKLLYPPCRVTHSSTISTYASSAIDISDGFTAGVGALIAPNNFGAELLLDKLPIDKRVRSDVSEAAALEHFLTSGEEYEQLFTVPRQHEAALAQTCSEQGLDCHRIGKMVTQPGVRIHNGDKSPMVIDVESGYRHF